MTSSRQPSQPQLQKIARPLHASVPSSNAPQPSLVRRHLEGVHARARHATPGMLVLTTPSINLQRKNEPLQSALMGPLWAHPSVSLHAARKRHQKILPCLKVKYLNSQICRPY